MSKMHIADVAHVRIPRIPRLSKTELHPDLTLDLKPRQMTRRLSFYKGEKVTSENITHIASMGKLTDLSWFEFLVHTELCTMNYDGLAVGDDDRFLHLIRMMENLRVPQTLKKHASEIIPFLYDVKQLMHKNSYHNFCHVTDVTQYMYTLLIATHVAGGLRPIELAAAYIGAVCHDLDHPGLSNTFQNNEKTELSVRYNAESPLENHHLSLFEKLCAKHGLLDNLETGEERRRFRDIVQNMILATDMSKHGVLMKQIKDHLETEDWHPLRSEEGINLVLQIALKCADISNQARPWKAANRWNEAVYEEFYNEGDLDLKAGRNVAPLFDRRSNLIPQSTVGFINWVVTPLYQTYVDIMRRCAVMDANVESRAVEECLVFLQKNRERYQLAAKGNFVDPDESDLEVAIAGTGSEHVLQTSPLQKKKQISLPGINGENQMRAEERFVANAIKMCKLTPEVHS